MKDNEIKFKISGCGLTTVRTIELNDYIGGIIAFCCVHLNIRQRYNLGAIWFKTYGRYELKADPKHTLVIAYRGKILLTIGTFWFYQILGFVEGYMYYPTYYKKEMAKDIPLKNLYNRLPDNADVNWTSTAHSRWDHDSVMERIAELAANPPPTPVPETSPELRKVDALADALAKAHQKAKTNETSIS